MQVVSNCLINDTTNTIKYEEIKTAGGQLIKQYFILHYQHIGSVIEYKIDLLNNTTPK